MMSLMPADRFPLSATPTRPGETALSRRRLLVGATTAVALAATSLERPTAAGAGQGNIVLQDHTGRRYGPVLFLGDSTSSLQWRSMKWSMARKGLGPFRLDLQPGRLISRPGGWGTSGVQAVRHARKDGFGSCPVLIALGYPDLINRLVKVSPLETVDQVVATFDPLLAEIDPQQPVGLVNVYGRRLRSEPFNAALAVIARRRPNVYLFDWAQVARPHAAQWMQGDGFHPNYVGAGPRTDFLARAMIDLVMITRIRTRP